MISDKFSNDFFFTAKFSNDILLKHYIKLLYVQEILTANNPKKPV